MPTGVYPRKKKTVLERFGTYINKTDNCWNWIGRISPFGYGQFSVSWGDCWQAHRLAYEIYVGRIPKGKCVLHKCDNRKCVKPEHLWIGTQSENVRDMMHKGRGKKASSENNGGAKLTWEQVDKIRELRKSKSIYHKDLAEMFNVHESTIERIILKKSWK